MALLIRAEDAPDIITMEEAIDAVETGFRELGDNAELNAPRRRVMTREGARVSVHPGGVPSLGGIGVLAHSEFVATSTENQTYDHAGRPCVVLFDTRDSSLKGVLVGRFGVKGVPATRATQLRTSATSAVGTRHLAREDAAVLGLLGAGAEAQYHLLAFAAIRRFKQVKLFCRTPETRAAFCEEMQPLVSCELVPVDSARAAVEGADVVLTATNSNVPVFDGAWLKPGVHVTSIVGGNVGLMNAGLIKQRRREIDDATVQRADVIVANSREQAIQDQQGDFYEPVEKGILRWDQIGDLCDLLTGEIPGRTSPEQITLFKNNAGQGVADIAIASRIFDLASARELGVEF